MKPIFIISLPRSGSTLLQRILNNHSEIATTSEPWLLLPLIYMIKRTGLVSEYSHTSSYIALADLIKKLPNKEDDFYDSIRLFADSIYSKFCQDQKYFVDKTPRYFLIIDDIYKIYPDAKFIYLVRNPLDIIASIMTTWHNNRFLKLYKNYIDIYKGPLLIHDAFKRYQNNSFLVRYEELVTEPNKIIKDLCCYLDIDYSSSLVNSVGNIEKDQNLGDPTGYFKYDSKISSQSINSWIIFCKNPVRKLFLKRYIEKIGYEFFDFFNYPLSQVEKVKPGMIKNKSQIITDIIDIALAKIIVKFKLNLFFSRNLKWFKTKYLA